MLLNDDQFAGHPALDISRSQGHVPGAVGRRLAFPGVRCRATLQPGSESLGQEIRGNHRSYGSSRNIGEELTSVHFTFQNS